MIERPLAPPRPLVDVVVDGTTVAVREGSSVLEACRGAGSDVPTLCYLETLTPVNVCRVCVVEVEGSRPLVPACSRPVEPGMEISTTSERALHSRKLVFELLASSVDLGLVDQQTKGWMEQSGVDAGRFGESARAVEHQVKIQDELYIRDYDKCILCYKCVEACGEDAQNTFAIAISGRGFTAEVSTEFDVVLPESACVYCGNCIGVCPTGALIGRVEYDMRRDGTWDETTQTVTRTICPFCGVGCSLDVHVQENAIVKVTSPTDHSVTSGHLCIKGRFAWQHVHA